MVSWDEESLSSNTEVLSWEDKALVPPYSWVSRKEPTLSVLFHYVNLSSDKHIVKCFVTVKVDITWIKAERRSRSPS